MLGVLALAVLQAAPSAAHAPVDLPRLLTELTDRSALARWPDPPYRAEMASSREPASPAPGSDPFANHDASHFQRVTREHPGGAHVLLDAEVMAHVDLGTKKLLGKGAVAIAGIREWLRYRFPRFALEIDGDALGVVEATGFVVANLPQYAGQFTIVPGASGYDRKLELLLFHGRRRRDAVAFVLALARGRHLERSDVEVRSFTSLRIVAPASLQLQADGDAFVAAAPLNIALAPEQIQILAPRS